MKIFCVVELELQEFTNSNSDIRTATFECYLLVLVGHEVSGKNGIITLMYFFGFLKLQDVNCVFFCFPINTLNQIEESLTLWNQFLNSKKFQDAFVHIAFSRFSDVGHNSTENFRRLKVEGDAHVTIWLYWILRQNFPSDLAKLIASQNAPWQTEDKKMTKVDGQLYITKQFLDKIEGKRPPPTFEFHLNFFDTKMVQKTFEQILMSLIGFQQK